VARPDYKPTAGARLPAEAADLGEPLVELSAAGPARGGIVTGLCLLAAVVGIAVFALPNVKPDEKGLGYAVFGALAVAFVLMIALNVRKLGNRVWLFEEGFAQKRGGSVEACRWDEVESIRGLYTGAAEAGSRYSGNPILRARDGTEITVLALLNEDGETLNDELVERVCPQLLARAVAAIKRGEEVEFGPLKADKAGLRRADGGRLAWGQVGDVGVTRDTKLRIRAAGQVKSWFAEELWTIPNGVVLLALIEKVKGSADR
jgi:hypothetical protein